MSDNWKPPKVENPDPRRLTPDELKEKLAKMKSIAEPTECRQAEDGDADRRELDAAAKVDEIETDFSPFGSIVKGDEGEEMPRYHGCTFVSGDKLVPLIVRADKPLAEVIEDAFAVMNKALTSGRGGNQKIESPSAADKDKVLILASIMWLRSRGRFFWNEEVQTHSSCLYFDNEDCRLALIGEDRFKSWLAEASILVREDKSFKRLYSAVCDAAMSERVSEGVVPAQYYTRRGNAVYISSGDSWMIRCRDGKTEKVKNGADGVVFLKGQTLREWELLPDGAEARDPFKTLAVFRNAAYDEQAGLLLRSWVLNVFACNKKKPPLIIYSKFGQGKTTLAQAIQEMLGFKPEDHATKQRRDDEEAFWNVASSYGIALLDNAEGDLADEEWFAAAVEACSTGTGNLDTRKYTHQLQHLRPRADICLTTKSASFAANEGLADRCVIVRLGELNVKTEDERLFAEIEEHRNESMTWIAQTIAKALVCEKPIERSANRRHPDFSNFALRCAHVIGDYNETLDAIRSGEFDKAILVIEKTEYGSNIFTYLVNNGGRFKGSAKELYKAVFNADNEEAREAAKRFGNKLREMRNSLERCFDYRLGTSGGIVKHSFGGMKPFLAGLAAKLAQTEDLTEEDES